MKRTIFALTFLAFFSCKEEEDCYNCYAYQLGDQIADEFLCSPEERKVFIEKWENTALNQTAYCLK